MLYFNYVCGYSSNKITLVALFVSVRVSTIYSKGILPNLSYIIYLILQFNFYLFANSDCNYLISDYILMIHCKNETKKLNALAHKSKEIKFYLSKGLDL
jgi:hypothetical protein